MSVRLKWLSILCAVTICLPFRAFANSGFLVLAYHEVKETVNRDVIVGLTAVSKDNLEAQFQWLKDEGYSVVSFEQILQARAGKLSLPEKAVLLTFDDGYRDFYVNAFPLLKKFRYPAVLSLVGSWMALAPDQDVPLDGLHPLRRDSLLSWDEVREMVASGLIEVASHSNDLHRGLLGNPQGNLQPATVTRIYDPKTKTYEDDRSYRKRLDRELQESSDFIFKALGKRPRIMVWPFGEYNEEAIAAARKAGMIGTMGLREGLNDLQDLPHMRRMLITENPKLSDFATVVKELRKDRPMRAAHVDIDYVYDDDPAQLSRNLDALIERIHTMNINAVYLQAFADPDGDGSADALYFPNRHLPMRADLFNRVAWQLHTRTRVMVYAWLPVLAYKTKFSERFYVKEWKDGKVLPSSHVYHRLTPFSSKARKFVREIYEDLAIYSNFNGIIFHDDAILTDSEDVGREALVYARKNWDLPMDPERLRKEPELRRRWGAAKAQYMNDFTKELAEVVRSHRPELKTARNIYAMPVLNHHAVEWYAQDYEACLRDYDYVAIEAMPFMEKAADPDRWLAELVATVAKHPDGLRKTVIELQTLDWNTKEIIPMETILRHIEIVNKAGAVHLAYYPDKVHKDHPNLRDMRRVFSAPWKP